MAEYITGSHRLYGKYLSKIGVNFIDIENKKAKLREEIEKFTVWNERQFGFYFGLDVDC